MGLRQRWEILSVMRFPQRTPRQSNSSDHHDGHVGPTLGSPAYSDPSLPIELFPAAEKKGAQVFADTLRSPEVVCLRLPISQEMFLNLHYEPTVAVRHCGRFS